LVEALEIDYRKNVMAGMRWTNEWVSDADLPNKEFLFLIEK
jgi:adenine-specific DNA-methyltransferase